MTTPNPTSLNRPSRPRRLACLFAAALLGLAAPALAADAIDAATPPPSSAHLAGILPAPEGELFGDDQSLAPQAAAAPETGRLQSLVKGALALLGTPYRWGGTSPDGGFDCSGLVGYVFRSALGIELPRVSRDMAGEGRLVTDRAALAVGDLVFFSLRGKRVDHVGIYMGEGRFLHAPRTGKDVQVDNMASGYWSGKFLQGRRVADI